MFLPDTTGFQIKKNKCKISFAFWVVDQWNPIDNCQTLEGIGIAVDYPSELDENTFVLKMAHICIIRYGKMKWPRLGSYMCIGSLA